MSDQQTRPGNDLELKIHDGVVGALIFATVLLGMYVNLYWFWLTGAISLVMVSSSFTGFCPVHFILGKVLKSKK